MKILTLPLIAVVLFSPAAIAQQQPVDIPAQALATSRKLQEVHKIDRPFDGTVGDALAMIAAKHSIPITIKHSAFKEAGLDGPDQRPVKIPLMQGITLKQHLRVVQDEIDAEIVIRGSAIEITRMRALQAEFRSNYAQVTRFPAYGFSTLLLGIDEDPPLFYDSDEIIMLPLVHANFVDMPLDELLKSFADQSGVNIIPPAKLACNPLKLTMRFTNMPVDLAARLVADRNGYTCVRFRNTLYICEKKSAEQFEAEFDRYCNRNIHLGQVTDKRDPRREHTVQIDVKNVPFDQVMELISKRGYKVNVKKGLKNELVTANLGTLPAKKAVAILADMVGLAVVEQDQSAYVTTPADAERIKKLSKDSQ